MFKLFPVYRACLDTKLDSQRNIFMVLGLDFPDNISIVRFESAGQQSENLPYFDFHVPLTCKNRCWNRVHPVYLHQPITMNREG